MINKKQVAKEGEMRFAAEFVRNGWNIFLPYGEDSCVDLLIEKNGEYKRIQVKSTKPIKGVLYGRLKSSNNWQVKKYTSKEIDLFAIYDSKNKKGYILPIQEFERMTEPTLRLEKTKNSQQVGIRMASKYEYF